MNPNFMQNVSASRTSSADRRLIFLELNEINFEVAAVYAANLNLAHLQQLLQGCMRRTCAEEKYEELEPWIQWVSVHSGLTASQHSIFRLGDIVDSRVPQIFEQIEAAGLRVGAISAMNAENRLKKPAYFIPDPWTRTPTDGSFWSEAIGRAVGQAVNDNSSGKITPRNAVALLLGLIRFAAPRHWVLYLKLAVSIRKSPWRKSLLLDLFLHDLHMSLYRKARPNFSTLFLNAGAHIQHHYFFNAKGVAGANKFQNPAWYVDAFADPLGEMLQLYNRIIGELLAEPGTELIVATGLSQRPYDRLKYYWRLRDHANFLRKLGLNFSEVQPRMTRDFLVVCRDAAEAEAAQVTLGDARIEGIDIPVFGEIDNRGDSIFVTMTYGDEIRPEHILVVGGRRFALFEEVVFVAIKNGMHLGKGYAFFTPGVAANAPADGAHVASLHRSTAAYFGLA